MCVLSFFQSSSASFPVIPSRLRSERLSAHDTTMDIHCEDWYVGRIVSIVVSIGVWGEGTSRAQQAFVGDGLRYCRLRVMEELTVVR